MEMTGGHRRKKSSTSYRRACAECQKRKTRCMESRELQACLYCSKAGKRCTFEAPPSRTSLTRKNLDAAELRCKQLESILQSVRPGMDIEAAVRGTTDSTLDCDVEEVEQQQTKHESPRSSDEFEWHETALSETPGPSKDVTNAGDGMANLPTKAQDAGYLGNTSGSNLLQAISSLISPDDAWPSSIRELDPQATSERRSGTRQISSLQLAEQLATASIVDQLVDTYFQSYHSSYPILHEGTFREKCRNRNSGPLKTSFRITFYMVLAIGHWLSSPEKEHMQTPYYSAARSLFTIRLLEAGTLGTVQALLIMGNYLQKMDRPNTGYNFIGIAYRMALGLGLHREAPTQKHGDILAHERRRQVFWTLYCFDGGFSITTGRPTTISDTFIDVQIPRNINDLGCTMTTVVPAEVDYPTPYSAIIAQSKLAIIANRIHTILMAAQAVDAEADKNLASAEESIDAWRQSLPAYFSSGGIPSWFRASRAVLFWKEQNLRILLWQALERRPNLWPGRDESRLKCCTASLQAVFDITSFCRENTDLVHPGLSWYAVYFLFQATLVLLLYELQTARSFAQGLEPYTGSWMQGIAQARDCLTLLGKNNNAAKRCLAVLHRIQAGVLFASPGTDSASNTNTNDIGHPTFHLDEEQLGESGAIANMPLHDEASPETAAFFGNDWATVADPSLSSFLGDNSIQGFFQDFNGFPGTVEHNHFDYINYNMYNTG